MNFEQQFLYKFIFFINVSFDCKNNICPSACLLLINYIFISLQIIFFTFPGKRV